MRRQHTSISQPRRQRPGGCAASSPPPEPRSSAKPAAAGAGHALPAGRRYRDRAAAGGRRVGARRGIRVSGTQRARGNKFYPGLPADHAALGSPATPLSSKPGPGADTGRKGSPPFREGGLVSSGCRACSVAPGTVLCCTCRWRHMFLCLSHDTALPRLKKNGDE